MGLFSFLNKNKQETTAEDSGYFSREEETVATRARAKRASSADEPAPARGKKARSADDDPVLPEKKRARRRLVGAIALALAVAVGLPMLLDSEPKPLASDIAIQIPSRDKAPPLPLPAAPGAAVIPADSLDKREQFIEPPKAEPAKAEPTEVKTVALNAAAAEPKKEAKAAPKAPLQKPEPKAEPKAEPKQLAKAEPKAAEPKPVVKAPVKTEEKAAARPALQDADRALSILEGKAADAAPQKFVVQVAALGSADKVAELQDKLKEAGIRSYTHKVSTASGERIQVKLGPFSKEEADKMRAKLDKVGLAGSIVKPDGK